jgi:uncharacterized protein (TIGR03435 family)
MLSARRALTRALLSTLLAALAQAQTSFEVASVKPSRPDQRSTAPTIDPSRLSVRGNSLKYLVMLAYGIPLLDTYRVTGGPRWVETEPYDIEGHSENPVSRQEMLSMLGSLLADRFQLKFHGEMKPIAINVLTVAKAGPKFGPKFHPMEQGDPPANPGKQIGRVIYPGVPIKTFADRLRIMMSRDPVTETFVSIQDVPTILDETGLTGRYYIDFDADPHAEAWSATLEHQFGLTLNLRKAPTEIIVIDSVAKPSVN